MNRGRMVFAGLSLAMCMCTSVALAAGSTALLKARQKFFGIENVDVNTGAVKKDKVIYSWATNTTYVTSILGHVVLLDSYISKPELPTGTLQERYAPFLPQDFIDLKPEAIFLGHGHFDHADNAAYIAKRTGATIYASPETCDAMQADVAKMAADPNLHNGGAKVIPDATPVNCVDVVPRGSFPGEYDPATGKSRVRKLTTPLDAQVCVIAFKHIHSGTAPADPSFPHATLSDLSEFHVTSGRTITTPTPAVTYPAMYPTGTPYALLSNVALRVPGQLNTSSTGGIGGPYVMFYNFILKSGYNFTLSWVNSSGPAKEGIGADPGLVMLAQYNDPAFPQATKDLAKAIGAGQYALMDTLPSPDVFLGSIVSLGPAANQERDIVTVIQHLKPKVYVPGHITDVAQKGSAIYHRMAFRETALNMGIPQSQWPEFRLLIDPNYFAVPQVYTPGDPRWFDATKLGARATVL